MALVGGTRVQAVQDGDNTLAVLTDHVVDTETGKYVERKTAVFQAKGGDPVVVGQKISAGEIQVLFYTTTAGFFLV